MLKASAIIKQKKSVAARISMLEKEEKATREELHELTRTSKEEYLKNCDSLHNKQNQIECKLYELNILNKIYFHNYRIALFNEVMPIIIEILKKYEGKPYGEKTRKKISDEIKDSTGCYFYIKQRAYISDEIEICNDYIRYSDNLNIYVKKDFEILDGNNKIHAPQIDQLGFHDSQYIEDPKKRAKDIIKAWEKIKAKEEEFKKAISEFSSITPYGIDHPYPGKNIYNHCI